MMLCARPDVTNAVDINFFFLNDKKTRSKMGFIKALKTLEILEKPEVIFNRRLQSNPYYPFEKVGRNSKSPWLW